MTSVADLEKMSDVDLLKFVDERKVPHGATAQRPEILSIAREIVAKESAAKDAADKKMEGMPETKVVPTQAEKIPAGLSDLEVLRLIQSKGFRDAGEMRELFDVLQREKAVVQTGKDEVAAMHVVLEKRENAMTDRERALKEQAAQDQIVREQISIKFDKVAEMNAALKKAGLSAI